MIFPTLEFTLFFLVFLSIWQNLKTSNAKIFALSGFNIIFYGFYTPLMLLYLLGWTSMLYFAGKTKKLIPSLILFSIFELFFWKINEARFFSTPYKIITPLGISFFTFQGLTYIFGVSKKPSHLIQYHIETPWSFLRLLAFTGFFPTILSGPILRAKSWEEQLEKNYSLSLEMIHKGLVWISLGCLYKLCFSSILHDEVQRAFSSPKDENSSLLVSGMYSYSLEIFHDFAGYSLISIGIAYLMGFEIPENFKQPYFSLNMKEFWQKWHISLSSWLRDYLYFFLGGSKKGELFQIRNIAIVMTLSGLWHGMTINYLIWGGLHTLGIVIYHLYEKNMPLKIKIPKIISWAFILNYVSFAWIFFRSPDLPTSIDYIKGLVDVSNFTFSDFRWGLVFLWVVCLIFQFFENSIISKMQAVFRFIKPYPLFILFWATCFVFILIVSPAGMPPFIYFSY